MPNRRRRKLSTAMSAVAALAVASPVAIAALSELPAKDEQPQHRQFVQAALITDLPGELISALSQGLSQFGVNLPPMPTGILTGSPAASPVLTSPGLGATGLTSPGLTSPGLTPGLSTPGLGTTGLTPPTGLTTPGLGTPGLGGTGLGVPGEVPISAPIGLDPMAGTYPILGGDPSLGLGAPAATSGGGGLLGDLNSAAQQLGAGQAIDLLKGMVMPAIQSAIKQAAPAAAPAAAAAAPVADAASTAASTATGAVAQVASGAGA